jgi:hypothetical protein
MSPTSDAVQAVTTVTGVAIERVEKKFSSMQKFIGPIGLGAFLTVVTFYYIVIPIVNHSLKQSELNAEAKRKNDEKVADSVASFALSSTKTADTAAKTAATNEQLVKNNTELVKAVNENAQAVGGLRTIMEQIRDDQRKFPAIKKDVSP